MASQYVVGVHISLIYFFADDSIIFCKATLQECGVLQHILALYANVSGQVVNSAKTSNFFSYNTPQNIRNSICFSFGTSISTQFEKYLGLPPMVGRAKIRAFNEIKDRVFRRLQGWKENFFLKLDKRSLSKL
jgi:hypothetical protein